MKYQSFIWSGNYKNALDCANNIASDLSGDELKGYRGFWYYLAGSAAWLAAQQDTSFYEIARRRFEQAASCTLSVTWFRNLIQDSEEITADIDDGGHLSFLIEHLELELQRMGTTSDRKFNKRVNRILEGLNNNIDGNKFEQAHEDLGKLLGYNANNTEESGGPDPWWLARNDFCIAFEDYTETDGTKPIPTYKIRQLNDHPTWIREKESLSIDTEFIRVIITPANKVERTAVTIANNIFYWNQKNFVNWANKALQTIRELRLDFTGPGNEEWRSKAISVYRDAKLDPFSLKYMLSSYLLSDLENV